MKANTGDLVTRFLLEKLSESERRDVEERFLNDNEFFEEVLSAEDALIDQYLLGRLSDEERTRARMLFESSREQRLNVEFTKELIALVRASGLPEARSSSATLPVAAGFLSRVANVRTATWVAVVLIGVLLSVWIVFLHVRERKLETMRAAAEQSQRETTDKLGKEEERNQLLTRELETERQERQKAEELLAQSQSDQPVKVTSILLTPATFERGGESKVVSLNLKTERIRLQLALGQSASYEQYSLLITTFGGRKIWSSDSLTADKIRQGKLEVTLPARLFGYEDYKLELQGRSENGAFVHIADYAFKVRR